MQNTEQNFRQSFIVFEKPGILSENLKTLTSSNYLTVQYFLLNFAHIFYIPISTRACVGLSTFVDNSRSKHEKKKSHTFFCRHS